MVRLNGFRLRVEPVATTRYLYQLFILNSAQVGVKLKRVTSLMHGFINGNGQDTISVPAS